MFLRKIYFLKSIDNPPNMLPIAAPHWKIKDEFAISKGRLYPIRVSASKAPSNTKTSPSIWPSPKPPLPVFIFGRSGEFGIFILDERYLCKYPDVHCRQDNYYHGYHQAPENPLHKVGGTRDYGFFIKHFFRLSSGWGP